MPEPHGGSHRQRPNHELNGDEIFPPLPPRDYLDRRPLQVLVDRPMFRPQRPLAWQNENVAPNRQNTPHREMRDNREQREAREHNQRGRPLAPVVEREFRKVRAELEDLMFATLRIQSIINTIDYHIRFPPQIRQNVPRNSRSPPRSPNASEGER